jgi:hypothetical protein
MRFQPLPRSPRDPYANAAGQPRADVRRAGAAFLAGAAIFAAGLAWVANDKAGAMGGGQNPFSRPVEEAAPAGPSFSGSEVSLEPHKRKSTGGARGGGLAVCVRLCDGFFFPSNTAAGGDAACTSQCPDAPTALYRMSGGSDKIEDAVSANGAPYTALPVALRHRTTFDNSCTCHHGPIRTYSAMLMHDSTLRKDDFVMTPKGPVVFQGLKGSSIRRDDFVAVSQAPSLPGESRATLLAMTRNSGWDRRTAAFGLASASSLAVADDQVRRAKARSIWVDTPTDVGLK